MNKYKLVLFLVLVLLSMQFAHIAIFGLTAFALSTSQYIQEIILQYSFQLILIIGITFLIRKFKFNFKIDLGFPPLSVFLYLLVIFTVTFLLQNIFDLEFFNRLSKGELLFLRTDFTLENFIKNDINTLIISIVIAPILEEILYRYIIFTKLSEKFKLYPSIFITAALFGLMHSDYEGFVSYFFVGFILTFIYYSTKNIILNIIFHSLFNLLTYFTVFDYYENMNSFFSIGIGIYIICSFFLYLSLRRLKVLNGKW